MDNDGKQLREAAQGVLKEIMPRGMPSEVGAFAHLREERFV